MSVRPEASWSRTSKSHLLQLRRLVRHLNTIYLTMLLEPLSLLPQPPRATTTAPR